MSKEPFSFAETYTPRNNSLCKSHEKEIKEWIKKEVSLGRVEKGMTKEECKKTLGSNFVTTPILLNIKFDDEGKEKIHICRNTSKKYACGTLVNDHIDPDDFSTRWTTVDDCVEMVSKHSIFIFFLLPPSLPYQPLPCPYLYPKTFYAL